MSQPTICRIYRRITALLETVLLFTTGGLDEAIEHGHLILVDGTHIPTGNRPASGQGSANYSGKHKVQCLRVQVACSDRGDLLAVSDPVPGARHDAKAIELCGWDTQLSTSQWVADTAYTSHGAITPIKKQPHQKRRAWEKRFIKAVSKIRARIEHCIARLKDWKTLSKGYRGRLKELPAIIRIITQLELIRIQ